MPSKAAILAVGASLVASVVGQSPTVTSAPASSPAPAPSATFTPLASKHFEYTNLPYKADNGGGERGTQFGYNICNSTTEGQTSLCQTAMVNSLDDFCLWGPPEPNSLIGNVEGESVAWCTKAGRGTRVIPAGALTGVQFMRTKSYVQVVGIIKQTAINLAANDNGGELDPHGADRRGNPLGGLVFTNAFPSNNGNNYTFQQAVEWHNFMGANAFCFKACDPKDPDDAKYCQHIFDRIGCEYNAPAAYKDGVFESCEGENQDFPGIYTLNGQVMTYTQPPESAGDIKTMPYQPRVPASSNCVSFQSAQLYGGTVAAGPATATGASGSASRTGSVVASATSTGATGSNGALSTVPSFGFLAVGSVAFSALVGALAVL